MEATCNEGLVHHAKLFAFAPNHNGCEGRRVLEGEQLEEMNKLSESVRIFIPSCDLATSAKFHVHVEHPYEKSV